MQLPQLFTDENTRTIVENYLEHNNFQVVSYKLNQHGKDVNGFLGEHLSLQIEVQLHNSEEIQKFKFFVKRFPFEQELNSEYARTCNAYGREIGFYEVCLKELKKVIPGFEGKFVGKYFFGRDNEVVVFEDLAARGYTIAKKPSLNLLDLEHLRLVLKTLAEFHACSLIYEELKAKETGKICDVQDIMPVKPEETQFVDNEEHLGRMYLESCYKGLCAIIEQLPENCFTNKDFIKKIRELHDESIQMMKPQTKFRNVLCHGDLWPKNFMFKYENEVPVCCKLVDFQMIRHFPPAHDVLFLMFMTTNKEMRQHHFHSLIRYYHNCLKKELSKHQLNIDKILSFEDFKSSIHYYLPHIKLYCTYQKCLLSVKPQYLNKLILNANDYKEFIFGNRVPYQLKIFNEDEDYQILLTEAISELREILRIPKITREDCYKIMNRKLGSTYYTFDSFKLEPFFEASGFMGDYFKLKIFIQYKMKKRQFNFFVKSMPSVKSSKEFTFDTGAFSKEVFIYETFSQLAKHNDISFIEDCATKCYFARNNDIAVLDDLTLMGFRTISNLTLNELKLGLKKVAKFHATSIVYEEKMTEQLEKPFSILENYKEHVEEVFILENKPESFAPKFWTVGANSMDTVFELTCKSELKKFIPHLKDMFFKRVLPTDEFRNVICHGDLWSANLLFKYEDDVLKDCKLIDFQITRYCVPGHDVLGLIYLCSNREIRQKHMDELIEVYYKELTDSLSFHGLNIDEIYPREKFQRMLEHVRPQVLVYSFILKQFVCCTKEETRSLLDNEEISNRSFYDDRSDFIRQMFKTSENYRNVIKETVMDLSDYCNKAIV